MKLKQMPQISFLSFLKYFYIIVVSILLILNCSDSGSNKNDDDDDDDNNNNTAQEGDEDPINSNTSNPLLLINGGTFTIGYAGVFLAEPTHSVTISYNFYISKYEVTQKEYNSLMTSNPSINADPDLTDSTNFPVENVTWNNAIAFCNAKSQQDGLADAYDGSGNLLTATGTITTDITQVEGYRLLTEAEWEYVARNKGARNGDEPSGDTLANATLVAWYNNAVAQGQAVGTKAVNELGIYDMSGNILEWCHDWYAAYTIGNVTDPIGAATGTNRVYRGGDFTSDNDGIKNSYRGGNAPATQNSQIGFRVVRTAD